LIERRIVDRVWTQLRSPTQLLFRIILFPAAARASPNLRNCTPWGRGAKADRHFQFADSRLQLAALESDYTNHAVGVRLHFVFSIFHSSIERSRGILTLSIPARARRAYDSAWESN